jgi:DNA-binding NarL/FixJ family response regulator
MSALPTDHSGWVWRIEWLPGRRVGREPTKRYAVHRVLLVDDVGELRALVRLILERTGEFTVVAEAGNGLEAIDAASNEQPDIVLLDVSMPVMDGLAALPEIMAAAPEADIVMLSGFAEERLGEEARRLGAMAYLEKGVPPRELVARLLDLVGSRPR